MGWVRVMCAAGAAAAMAVLWASPSWATVMTLTVQGTASPAGAYAPFAASFPQFAAGQQPAPYSLQYTYDTSLASPISLARLTLLDGIYVLDGFSLSTVGPAGPDTLFYAALPTGGAYIRTDVIGGFGSGLNSPFSLSCPQGCGSGALQLPFGAGALNLSVTSASSAIVPAPAPEPEAWVLMITGFGLIGAMLRRRRSGVGVAI